VTRERAAISVGRGQDRPERARACLLADEAGAAAAADYAHDRPRPGESSRRVIEWADRPHASSADSGPAGWPGTADARETASHALWLAPYQAPDGGADVTGLVRMTGWMRTRLDRHRRQYAAAGRAIGVSGGRWRARRPGGRSV
jgi:hypothetical protein